MVTRKRHPWLAVHCMASPAARAKRTSDELRESVRRRRLHVISGPRVSWPPRHGIVVEPAKHRKLRHDKLTKQMKQSHTPWGITL